MILLCNIIKAECVFYDNSIKQKVFKEQPQVIKTTKKDLFEIYNHREIILKEAEEEAMKITNAARINVQTEIAQCKKKAYEDGYNAGTEIGKNKGYEEGYEAGYEEISRILQEQNEEKVRELAEMLEKIENEKQEIISKYESQLTNLSIDIAEKIIRNEIDTKDNIVSSIIRNVISDYRNVEWIKVYISSKDNVIAIQADKKLISELKKISKDVKIEVLDQIDKGSAIVETENGIVEASIDTQLKNFKEMVLSKNAG